MCAVLQYSPDVVIGCLLDSVHNLDLLFEPCFSMIFHCTYSIVSTSYIDVYVVQVTMSESTDE